VGEPFRITLHLENSVEFRLEIYPASFWDRLLIGKNKHITKKLAINYCFKTEEKRFLRLVQNKNFITILEQDEVYIRLYAKEKQLVLTPKKGIKDLSQVENFFQLLKILENEVLTR